MEIDFFPLDGNKEYSERASAGVHFISTGKDGFGHSIKNFIRRNLN